MKHLAGIVVVAVVSVFNLYVGVPSGYGFDLDPVVIGIAAFVGSVGGTVTLVFVGDRVMPLIHRARERVMPSREKPEEPGEPSGRIRRVADRFGAPGIGLIGPLTIGGFASAVSGVALGFPKVQLAIWIGIGQGLVVIGFLFLLDTAVA